MQINKELLDEMLKNCKTSDDLFGEKGVFTKLKKAMVERMLEAEMSHHLGYEKHETAKNDNYRNGKATKKVITNTGDMEIAVPRDRNASFEPQLIGKYQRRLPDFDDTIISLYARGMTVRDIQSHIEEIYQTNVSPDLISAITDEVMDEVNTWRIRPLDMVYPILYLDAIVIKVRDDGQVKNKSLYLAIGINLEGNKEVLGMWMSLNEGAKFWLSVVNELKNRNVQDILIACVDGLKGFPDAINTVFPQTQIQQCIVHMVRNSLKYVPWKDRKAVARDLKAIYTSCNEEQALAELANFRQKWDSLYPTIGDIWERNWSGIIPFLAYPDYIRKAIYTTNTIESINNGIRKVTRNRSIFPDDNAAFKLIYLALHNLAKRWNRPIINWKEALNQFAIIFGDRLKDALKEGI
jgi:putative transposase